jgi:DNA polymerase-3 subunit beta
VTHARLDAATLAGAAGWVAAAIPARPAVPVLGGMLLRVADGRLTLSGFDHDVSGGADLDLVDGHDGVTLVPGPLFARIVGALPRQPVSLSVEGSSVVLTCATARFTLPVLPVGDFPDLPAAPAVVGTVDAAAFAGEVARVALAASRDETVPVLATVRVELDGDLTLVAIDRYRLAVGRLAWRPTADVAGASVLLPARAVADLARGLGHVGELGLAVDLARPGSVRFSGGGRHRTVRTVDGTFVPYRSINPTSFGTRVEVSTAALTAAVNRVALVAEVQTPVRLALSAAGAAVSAGGGAGAGATEHVPVTLTGDDVSLAVNPRYLLDGLKAVTAETVTLSIADPHRPVVLGSPATPYTYTVMPVRSRR